MKSIKHQTQKSQPNPLSLGLPVDNGFDCRARPNILGSGSGSVAGPKCYWFWPRARHNNPNAIGSGRERHLIVLGLVA
jgi:hypothetical protein